jgi:hypothetical protein
MDRKALNTDYVWLTSVVFEQWTYCRRQGTVKFVQLINSRNGRYGKRYFVTTFTAMDNKSEVC